MKTKTQSFRDSVITPRDTILRIVDMFRFEPMGSPFGTTPGDSNVAGKNEPSHIEYARVVTTLEAYGYGRKLNETAPVYSFVEGRFIDDDFITDEYTLTQIGNTLEKYVSVDAKNNFEKLRRLIDYRFAFFLLIKYRRDLYLATRTLADYYLANPALNAAFAVKKELQTRHLSPMIKTLDKVICSFFAANDRVKDYTVGELIDKYGYPTMTDGELRSLELNML